MLIKVPHSYEFIKRKVLKITWAVKLEVLRRFPSRDHLIDLKLIHFDLFQPVNLSVWSSKKSCLQVDDTHGKFRHLCLVGKKVWYQTDIYGLWVIPNMTSGECPRLTWKSGPTSFLSGVIVWKSRASTTLI